MSEETKTEKEWKPSFKQFANLRGQVTKLRKEIDNIKRVLKDAHLMSLDD